MPPSAVRLYYVDDSGAPDTGYVVYSWISCLTSDWGAGLRAWLDLRKRMYAAHRIPPSYELHAAHFIGGHGRPSTIAAWNASKLNRVSVMQQALAAIGSTECLSIGTVFRLTNARGSGYASVRADVYNALVRMLDDVSASSGEQGIILMDGNGSEHRYYAAHRGLKLSDRHIIEDPLFQASHRSQWVQMADLVAWTAYQGLHRANNRRLSWDWYERYVSSRDARGGPVAI